MPENDNSFQKKLLEELAEKNKILENSGSQIAVSDPIVKISSIGDDNSFKIFNNKGEFTAFGAISSGPTSGGFKDILVIPGIGGTSADTSSQINFYWSAGYTTSSGTVPSTNVDANKRTTIFNYAETTSGIPVLAIGGYDGTTYYSPSTNYGGGSGQTLAKIWIHPFSGRLDATTIDLSPNTADISQINFGTNTSVSHTSITHGQMAWTGSQLKIHDGTSIKTVAFSEDAGSADQLIAVTSSDASLYPIFVSDLSTSAQTVFTGNATYTPIFNGSDGTLTLAGNLLSSNTTATIFNTTTTDLTIGGAATAIALGSTTGTLTLNNPSIVSSTTSLNLFNTVATTVNAFGDATTVGIGSTSGTLTINNPTLSTPASTFNLINTNATTINAFNAASFLTLGYTGVSSSTTNVSTGNNASGIKILNLGTGTGTSDTLVNIGATVGTTYIKSTNFDLTNVSSIVGTTASLNAFNEVTSFTLMGTSGASTSNFATGAIASSVTKIINIGTGGADGSITNITIGPSTSFLNNTISFNGNRVQGVGTPTQNTDAANKAYVDSQALGLDVHNPVRIISVSALGGNYNQTQAAGTSAVNATITGTSNGAFPTIDTITLVQYDRILVQGGISGTITVNGSNVTPGANIANGVYELTTVGDGSNPWQLTRTAESDTSDELEGGTFLFVLEGSSYADTGWVCTNDTSIVFGTDNIEFVQFSSAGQLQAGDGLVQIGTAFNVVGATSRIDVFANNIDISTSYVGQTSITTLGTITTGIWGSSATNIAVASGGTGTSSQVNYGIAYYDSTKITTLNPGSSGTILQSSGTSSAPQWSTATYPGTAGTTQTLLVSNGTNFINSNYTLATTFAVNTLLYASSADSINGLATSSTSVLVSNSTGVPSWASGATANRVLRTNGSSISFAQVDLSTDVTGTLPISNGGTNTTSVVANAIIYASSTTALESGSTLTWNPTASGTGTSAALYIGNTGTGNALQINPTNAAYTGTALAVNISTSSTGAKLIDASNAGVSKFSVDANGNLRAVSKSFDIPHPTKTGKRLVYGVLEGPEHGVYHRGHVKGKGLLRIDLPEYWSKLASENYTIQLTPYGNYNVHIVEKNDDYFIIKLSGNYLLQKNKTFEVDYIVHGCRTDAPLDIEQ